MKIKINGYLRCSTQEQGNSKLGLKAQEFSITQYAKANNLIVENWYTDIKSGKDTDRPELQRCIADSMTTKTTMVVAKSCRLSRDISDGFALRKIGVDIKILDTNINSTIEYGVKMLFNQQEREEIARRTRQALHQLRLAGVVLGKPENFNDDGRAMGRAVMSQNASDDPKNKQATALIMLLRRDEQTYAEISSKLNELKMTTRRGKTFNPKQVQRLYLRQLQLAS